MTEQSQSMPIEKIYEIIGRISLQLWSSQENQQILVKQVQDLSEQNIALNGIVNEYRTGKISTTKPIGEALVDLAEMGIKVTERQESVNEYFDGNTKE